MTLVRIWEKTPDGIRPVREIDASFVFGEGDTRTALFASGDETAKRLLGFTNPDAPTPLLTIDSAQHGRRPCVARGGRGE